VEDGFSKYNKNQIGLGLHLKVEFLVKCYFEGLPIFGRQVEGRRIKMEQINHYKSEFAQIPKYFSF